MTAGQRAVLLWGLILTLVVGAACRTEEPLPDLWPAPEFALADQQGRPFGSADLAGRAAVVDFIYTNCPDICPLRTATMAKVQDTLRAEGLLGARVQLVSVTVDPDRDTPAVLAEYAGRYHADPDDWRFLSGDREAVYGVLEGFKLNTREVARAYAGAAEVPHSDRFVVVDPAGHVRAQLPGDEAAPEDLVRTVKRVLPR